MEIRLPSSAERWPLARIRPSARNPRTHPREQIEKLKRSFNEFGCNNPLLVDATGELIAGEGRFIAASELAMTDIVVIVLDHLTPQQRDAYRIADNRIAEEGGWDEAKLAAVLRDLEADAFDLLATGFNEDEIAALLEPEPEGDPNRAEPPPAVPITQLGDIWQLGAHRLICGDCTRSETLAALFSGARPAAMSIVDSDGADLIVTDPPYGMAYDGGRAKADLVLTDPPYGMSFGAGKVAGSTAKGATVKAHGMILNDDVRGDTLVALVREALARAIEWAKPGAAAYVCFTWRTYAEFEAALEANNLSVAACIVWNKGSIGLGYQHYRPQHEFIFYCKGTAWYGGNAESDVWEFSRGNTGEYVHPTQKPVALLERAIVNSSRVNDIVLDVFGGSGSTLIACERRGRQARLVELDPKYCDAIVARWEKLTGKKAIRTHAAVR